MINIDYGKNFIAQLTETFPGNERLLRLANNGSISLISELENMIGEPVGDHEILNYINSGQDGIEVLRKITEDRVGRSNLYFWALSTFEMCADEEEERDLIQK